MARVKLTIPEKICASIKITVRISDINYGNHLGNDSLVSILQEARVQWLQQNNYTELNIEGIGLIMADLVVEYISEAFYGDSLNIEIAAADISRVSFDLFYSIRNRHSALIAKAKTGMVCYDYQNKKVTTIPEQFRILLSK